MDETTPTTPAGKVDAQLVTDAAARRQRLRERFDAIALLDRTMANLYHANEGRFRMTGPALKVLAVSWGKALKTFDAIRVLCESGYGEDAVILARGLVNLAINLGYIGRAPDPDVRAEEFISAGRITQRDFLGLFQKYPRDWGKDVDWELHEERAKRWPGVNIRRRAEVADLEDLYLEFYKFGSSYEHSDSWSVASYWGASDDTDRQIVNHPTDDLVAVTLGYTFKAMAVLTEIVVAGFQLDEPERIDLLRRTFEQLGADKVARPS